MERLLALRQRGPDGKYVLEQSNMVSFLKQIWGKDSVSLTPHVNDCLRLFGIVMSLPDSRFDLQRLCDGVTGRYALDDPTLSLKQIFVEIALAFNNKEVEVVLPEEAYDLEYIHLLDPNDNERMKAEIFRRKLIDFVVSKDGGGRYHGRSKRSARSWAKSVVTATSERWSLRT